MIDLSNALNVDTIKNNILSNPNNKEVIDNLNSRVIEIIIYNFINLLTQMLLN